MCETLCWECRNAAGGCSWADDLKPVDGWDAEKTIVQGDGAGGTFDSFCVKSCPEYVPDDRRIISTREIARILGITQTTAQCKWAVGKVIEEMEKKGYTVKYNRADKLWYEIRR